MRQEKAFVKFESRPIQSPVLQLRVAPAERRSTTGRVKVRETPAMLARPWSNTERHIIGKLVLLGCTQPHAQDKERQLELGLSFQ